MKHVPLRSKVPGFRVVSWTQPHVVWGDSALVYTYPGEIGPGRDWIFINDSWMYGAPTFVGMIKDVITNFRKDNRLVGW